MDLKPPLYLLTGPIGAGKSTFCRQLAKAARSRGWQVGGLLSPARMENGQKTGILLEDLQSHDQRVLAIDPLALGKGRAESVHTFTVGKWRFDPQVLEWGNELLANCAPCDLLIVDELGPLEFNNGRGLTGAFEQLSAGHYRVGCVVVRSALLDVALDLWPWAEVLPMAEATIHKIL